MSSPDFGPQVRTLFSDLSDQNTTLSEQLAWCRIDHVGITTSERHATVQKLAALIATDSSFSFEMSGDVLGPIIPETSALEDIRSDRFSIILRKETTPTWCCFFTEGGFEYSLAHDEITQTPRAIWIAAAFEPFQTASLLVGPWNGPTAVTPLEFPAERPRKLVRDLTFTRTPVDIAPWLLSSPPRTSSRAFDVWRKIAIERLLYVLPSEIRSADQDTVVVLKGPRARPIFLGPPAAWSTPDFTTLNDAAAWIYLASRDAETRFQFLNNHLSLDWREGLSWSEGLKVSLHGSLISAREAFAFYLQDQSKDALKTLGDLRKALQDEVAKAQSATRDLQSALWRDLAIAGVVLALKIPTSLPGGSADVLYWVMLATASLLVVSLATALFTNWRFNQLADRSRKDWRGKLYAFMPEYDWQKLVERPIRRGRRTYRITVFFVILLYGTAAYYLAWLADPARVGKYINPIFSWLLGTVVRVAVAIGQCVP